MSYQGHPASGTGYWAGQTPPNVYAMQDSRQQHSHHPPNPPRAGPSQIQQPQYQASPIPSSNLQQWSQNGRGQYSNAAAPTHPNHGYQHAPAMPQYQQPLHQHQHQHQFQQQPMFISPAQLLHQTNAQPRSMSQHYQRNPQSSKGRVLLNPNLSNPSPMHPTPPRNTHIDTAMLLISLAEEYFDAAEKIGPETALSMTHESIDSYQKLIATGLACLDTALKNARLPPRLEAKVTLRYSSVLLSETENSMETESTLTKGIALCERNHYYDLKYAMQFILAQSLARKNPKASMKALEGQISEANAYQHFAWVYVFRLLRASHALESGTLTDTHAAVQNLQSVASLAIQQNDYAIYLTAALMEAIAYMRMTGPEAAENVQRALAAAYSYQMDESCKIPQLISLTHILDVASSIRQGVERIMVEKLKAMQVMIDNVLKDPSWSGVSDTVAIPIRRTPNSSSIVSQDTRMILGIGDDGGDNLMMTFISKKDAYAITNLLCGLVLWHKYFDRKPSDPERTGFDDTNEGQKGLKFLRTSLETLEGTRPFGPLPELVSKRLWRGKTLCYLRIYIAFCWTTSGEWTTVKRYLDELKDTATRYGIPLTGPLKHFATYVTGVYHQGIGDFEVALQIFQGGLFTLPGEKNTNTTVGHQVEREVAILATLNSIWILQDKSRQNPGNNTILIEKLRNLCLNHPNRDIEAAYNLVAATVHTDPPKKLLEIKTHLNIALTKARSTANEQFLAITLIVMCGRFFSGVVGEQAEKSAMAASAQAKKSKNILWMSVADGMLARCYEAQGKRVEAQATLSDAQALAQRAFSGR